MQSRLSLIFTIAILGCLSVWVVADEPKKEEAIPWNVGKIVKEPSETPSWTDSVKAEAEFAGFKFMGEYTRGNEALQVVPAQGEFYLSIYEGGLPGANWNGEEIKHEWVDADSISQRLDGWAKIDRSGKLDFAGPPPGAIALFDGEKHEHWKFGQVSEGLLQAGARTKQNFTDFKLHFECMTPLKPTLPLSHPGRGNSGVFALGAYEIQVMDTFGLDPSPRAWEVTPILKKPDTWCGSIYGIRPPSINVCLPPLSWQTFDVEFTAARFEGEKKVRDAVMTVYHTGLLIQDQINLPEGTGGGPSGPRDEVATGPIYFQKHGSPVQYRNIWIISQ